MFRLYIFLFIPLALLANVSYTKSGKKIYNAITSSIKSNTDIVPSAMNSSLLKVPVIGEKITPPQEREIFLKEQFTSKKDLLGVRKIEKEKISVNQEIVEFFNSLNNHVKKPINIE